MIPMREIFKNIVAAVIANPDSKLTADNCSLVLEQNRSMAPTLADRHNATRPDGYLVVKDRFDENEKYSLRTMGCYWPLTFPTRTYGGVYGAGNMS